MLHIYDDTAPESAHHCWQYPGMVSGIHQKHRYNQGAPEGRQYFWPTNRFQTNQVQCAIDTMSLILSIVDTATIGRMVSWCSYVMIHYLHMSAQTFTEVLVSRIVQYGDYELILLAHKV